MTRRGDPVQAVPLVDQEVGFIVRAVGSPPISDGYCLLAMTGGRFSAHNGCRWRPLDPIRRSRPGNWTNAAPVSSYCELCRRADTVLSLLISRACASGA